MNSNECELAATPYADGTIARLRRTIMGKNEFVLDQAFIANRKAFEGRTLLVLPGRYFFEGNFDDKSPVDLRSGDNITMKFKP